MANIPYLLNAINNNGQSQELNPFLGKSLPTPKTLTPAQKAPAAPKTLNTSGLLQALARQKAANGVVGQNGYNEADKGNLAYAQKNGWVAPTATPVSPTVTPPAKNAQGLTADQIKQYANGQIDINGNPKNNGNQFDLFTMNNNPSNSQSTLLTGNINALSALPKGSFALSQMNNGQVPSSTNSVGVKANNPNQNITPTPKTLTPAQKAPAAPKTLNTSGLLQALARQKAANGVVGQNGYNEADKGNLAYAQKNGWVAPTATPVSPTVTPPAKNAQGLTADQIKQYANGQIDINGNPITNASSVGKLVNSAVSAPTAVAPAITGLTNTATTNPGNSGPAYDAYQNTLQQIAKLKSDYATKTQGIASSAGDLQYGTGEQNSLIQSYNTQLQGLQDLASAQANALGYQISGVQTQQTGYNEAGELAQNAQGQTQSGLTAAAGLSLPQQVPYGTPLVNPQTGQNINMTAGSVDPSDPFYKTMQSYAQLMVNNQGSAIPTSITGNSVLNAQLIKMAQQINPNFNVNVAAGAGSAQGGSAASQYSQVESWKSSLQQGQNLQSQFTDLMNTYGLNPSDINKFNTGIQSIANNTSDPRYKMFNNYIADIANTYAQILTPAGGNVSDYKTQIANSMLDASMKGTGLVDVMKGLDQQAQAKIAGVSTGGGLGGNSGGSGGSGSSGSSLYSW